MHGDFSRNPLGPVTNLSRVLMQQGRVQLDYDWNQQNAILLHLVRTLAKDLIGDHGGSGESFKIAPATGDQAAKNFSIKSGHYYVNGILCENDSDTTYLNQPDFPAAKQEDLKTSGWYFVYLEVWERHITQIEDDSFGEVALGGADTATRVNVVWQVKVAPWAGLSKAINGTDLTADEKAAWLGLAADSAAPSNGNRDQLAKIGDAYFKELEMGGGALLCVRTEPKESAKAQGPVSAQSSYRSPENHLYRVEIHQGSVVEDGVKLGEESVSGAQSVKEAEEQKKAVATFKWSRDNGILVYPIRDISGNRLTLEHLGNDSSSTLDAGHWVEIVDDHSILSGKYYRMRQLQEVDPDGLAVTLTSLDGEPSLGDEIQLPELDDQKLSERHFFLRRWDHGTPDQGVRNLHQGAVAITKEDLDNKNWLPLEAGIEIQFSCGGSEEKGKSNEIAFRKGDYWLLPARDATNGVIWPREAAGRKGDDGKAQVKSDEPRPKSLEPFGEKRNYAPLALINISSDGTLDTSKSIDLRKEFKVLAAASTA